MQSQIKNQKSKVILETPKRGQSIECPDRLFRKKRLFLQSNFLGVTPAPQYSLNLTSNNVTVKRRHDGRQASGPSSRQRAGETNCNQAPDACKLLHLDGCTRIGELLLNRFSLFLRNGFLDGLRSSFYEVFGFLQTQSRNLANDLNDVDFIAAYGLQDHVKLGLLFCRSRCFTTAARRCRRRHRCRSRVNAEGFLQLLHEL